jgi:hypothetical protein
VLVGAQRIAEVLRNEECARGRRLGTVHDIRRESRGAQKSSFSRCVHVAHVTIATPFVRRANHWPRGTARRVARFGLLGR